MTSPHLIATQMATHVAVRAAGACPTAPSAQVQSYADDILGWVKWGVLAILAVSFFASVGMIIWGRVTHHPKGARLGFDGLMICLLGAVLYVAGYTVITGITGC
ncbi:hypothetical protein [Kineosporia sp. R_H_3]|uniref:hypothetical protein n=1 Tax=Kineosporia sp. R_H_3 TaxID=1961848 RepID=UPI0018E950BF|nr:hypothetical protein [Kineosporia sp. R_H_3]